MTNLSSVHRRLSSQDRIDLQQVLDSDPVDWLEHNFYISDPRDPVTGDMLPPGPIVLAEHQKRIVRAALTRVDGRFPYVTILYSAVKKSGKTRLAAGVSAWYAATSGPYNEIYCMANDGQQSMDRILSAIKQAVTLGSLNWHVTKTRVTLPGGTYIEAIPCDPTGQAGANPGLTTWSEMWGYRHQHKERLWCFDEKTEVLTSNGWKNHTTLSMDDKIATLNPETGTFEWQLPNGIFHEWYDGDMYRVDHQSVSMLVTPDHRVYGKFCSKADKLAHSRACWELMPVSEASNKYSVAIRVAADGWTGTSARSHVIIPRTMYRPPLELPIGPWVRFMGWYMAEGYSDRGTVNIARSMCASPGTWDEIIELCRELGFNPKLRSDRMVVQVHDVRIAKYLKQFGLSYEKFVPRWLKELPVRYLKMFLDTYFRGDGYRQGSGFNICTVSKRMADDLLEIGIKCGFFVRLGCYDQKNSDRDIYVVRFRTTKQPKLSKKHWSVEHYEGYVFCPSTDNEIVLARRDGTIYFTGNSEMTVPPTRWGHAFRLVESYAGYSDESLTLESLYNLGVNQGRRHPDFPDLPVYTNDAAKMFCYWDHKPRMAWQTPDYYAQEAAILSPDEFRRIHRNEWVTSTEKAIPVEWWDACLDTSLGPLGPREPAVLGLDASISHDSCAAVIITRHPNRRKDTAIRSCRIWVPPRGGKIDLTETLEKYTRKVCKQFNIVGVPYDRYELHKMVTDLRKEGVARFIEFSQGADRAVADKMIFEMILQKSISHNDDQQMREHVDNAYIAKDGKKLRFVKPSRATRFGITMKPIDALVAASMANFECLRLNLG